MARRTTDYWALWALENGAERSELLSTMATESIRDAMKHFINSNALGDAERYELFVRAVRRLGEDGVRARGTEEAIDDERRRSMGVPACPECQSFNVTPDRARGPWRCAECGRAYGGE